MLKNKYLNRIISYAAVVMLITLCAAPAFSEGEAPVINISSAADFVSLAKNCTYDSYSRGMQVTLMSDIDMSETEIEPMKIFCGVFEGGGHSITGVKLNQEGSQKGLCFELGEGGEIRNLNISGSVKASSPSSGGASLGEILGNVAANAGINTAQSAENSAAVLGGIIGKNSGKIVNCSFDGVVDGETAVGGIAGENTNTGVIESCRNLGSVKGKTAVGGIAGINSGVIKTSTNEGGVNYDPTEGSHNIGGICGTNPGLVSGCENRAVVGYKNVGDNIGGIAGRQNGCITSCRNYGEVLGEQSVGGIFGRFEPYAELTAADIQRVKDDLNEFHNQVSADVNNAVNAANGVVNNASNSADNLRQNVNDDLNDLISRVSGNGSSNIISAFSDRLNDLDSGIQSTLSDAASNIDAELSGITDRGAALIDSIDSRAREDITDAAGKIGSVADSINSTADTVNTLVSDVDGIVGDITDAYNNGDMNAVDNGLARLDERLDYMEKNVIDPMAENANSAMNSVNRAADTLRSDANAAANALEGPVRRAGEAIDDFRSDVETVESGIDSARQKIKDVRDKIHNLPNITPKPGGIFGALRDFLFTNVYADEPIGLNDDQIKSELKDINSVDVALPRTVSGENTDNALVIYCLNDANVSGRKSAGGIGGTVGIESAVKNGDNITLQSGGILTNSSYVKAVIDGCVSNGEIYAKDGYAGGIAGDAALGIIKNCACGSSAKSDSEYVGGIAGSSSGKIYDCAAISDLTATRLAGGIAGSGKFICECYALPRIFGGTEKTGAIAGQADGTVINNYFIKENLNGIDGTDYEGKAVALLPEEITGSGTLPARMVGFNDDKWYMANDDIYLPQNRALSDNADSDIGALLKAESADLALFKFDAKFEVDGNTLYETTVNYGDVLDPSLIPELEYRDGYCPQWSEDTTAPIIRDTIFKAEYTDAVKTIATGDDPPTMLVEGNFRDGTEVTAHETEISGEFPRGCEALAAYEFDISPDYQGNIKVHIRDKDGKGNCAAIDTEEGTKIIKGERDGSYMVFETAGEGKFTVLHRPNRLWPVLGIAGAALIALAVIILIARKKRKQANKKQESESA